MKTLISLLALVVLLTVTSCGNDAEAEKEKLEARFNEFWDAYAINDTQSLGELVHPDSTRFVGTAAFQGVQPLADAVSDGPFKPERTIHQHKWIIGSDVAVLRSHETWQSPSGPWENLATWVWVKNDGQWQLQHMHHSDMH